MTKSRILTFALIVVLVILAGAAWLLFGKTAAGMDYMNAEKYTVGGTTVTSPVENLYVDWTAGRVNVEYHSGEGVIVSEKANRELSDDDKLRWWLDGTTLRIRYARSGLRLSFNLDKELTVSLPEGTVLQSADIGTTSGDMNIPGLIADEIRLASTSGDINAVTVTKTLAASSTSGSLVLRQDTDIDSVSLGSTSGSIDVTLTNVNSLTAESTSGSVRAAVSESAASVRLRSTSGNIVPELAAVSKAEISSTSGSVSGSVASFADLKIGTTSGEVSVNLPEKPGFTCRVSTASGSFSSGLAFTQKGTVYTCGDGSAVCAIDTSSGDIFIGAAE